MFKKIQDSLDDDGVHSSHSQQQSEGNTSNNGHGDDNSFDGDFDGNEVATHLLALLSREQSSQASCVGDGDIV